MKCIIILQICNQPSFQNHIIIYNNTAIQKNDSIFCKILLAIASTWISTDRIKWCDTIWQIAMNSLWNCWTVEVIWHSKHLLFKEWHTYRHITMIGSKKKRWCLSKCLTTCMKPMPALASNVTSWDVRFCEMTAILSRSQCVNAHKHAMDSRI